MGYFENLQKEIDLIYNSNPEIKSIIEEIQRIDAISGFEFDVKNEREYLKVTAIKKIFDEKSKKLTNIKTSNCNGNCRECSFCNCNFC
jgi:hypothetical protein